MTVTPSSRPRKPLVDLPGDIIGGKAGPFVDGEVDQIQLVDAERNGAPVARVAKGPVVDRKRPHIEPGFAEEAHRARHVVGRGHQKRLLTGLGLENCGAEARVFVGVARARFDADAIGGDAEADKKIARLDRLGGDAAERPGAAPRVEDARAGIAAGKQRRFGQPRRAFFERDLPVRLRQLVVDGSPQRQDPDRGRARRPARAETAPPAG